MPLLTETTTQLRQYVPVVPNFDIAAVLPDLQQTRTSLLPRFLGQPVADQLEALSELQDSPLTSLQNRALHLARTAVFKIGFAGYLAFAEVQIGNDGITVSAMDGRKAAFQYQTDKLGSTLLEVGWRALDELITLVATAPSTVFTGWDQSPYYKEHTDALFTTAQEFSKYYPIQDRWLTFWALRPFIRAVEDGRGSDTLATINALPNTVTDSTRAVLHRRLLRAIAYQAVLEGMPNLSVEINGVNLQVNYSSQFGNTQYYQAPGKDQLSWLLDNLTRQADLAWATVDSSIAAQQPDTLTDTTGTGLLFSTGAFTMI